MSGYNLVDISDNFNDAINRLIEIVDQCVGESDRVMFTGLTKKITMMINTDPIFIMDAAGKYLYKYRDIISTDQFGDFVMNTEKYIFQEDSKEAQAAASGEQVNFAKSMLSCLRLKWTDFSDKEKKRTHKIVKKMLSEYCKYVAYSLAKN